MNETRTLAKNIQIANLHFKKFSAIFSVKTQQEKFARQIKYIEAPNSELQPENSSNHNETKSSSHSASDLEV